jgi:hypothetical protein
VLAVLVRDRIKLIDNLWGDHLQAIQGLGAASDQTAHHADLCQGGAELLAAMADLQAATDLMSKNALGITAREGQKLEDPEVGAPL